MTPGPVDDALKGFPSRSDSFPPTAWTLVQRAVSQTASDQDTALNELLTRYWMPIYVYLRRSGRAVPEAEDLTQGFFAHLLTKGLLQRVRVRQVRFRAYLRSVLEHYLANEARIASAKKRRGGLRLDVTAAEGLLAAAASDTPAQAYADAWAIELLEAACQRLRNELTDAGRAWVAAALARRSGLSAPDVAAVQELARCYGVNENQLTVALHRARARLREIILEEIRDSVASAEEAAEELNDLFAALGRERSGPAQVRRGKARQ